MANNRRNDFVKAIADFLKISLENSITKEYLEAETGFIADDWYLDFINHLGNTKADFKRPLDVFTSAINSYKTKKFEILYANAKEQSKEILGKLENTFRLFDDNKIPPEHLQFSSFMQINQETKEKKPTFTKKELTVLKLTGLDWHYLFNRRYDTYMLMQTLETASKKSVEAKIKETAIKLGNAPQIGHQANKLLHLVNGEPIQRSSAEKINPKVSAMLKGAMAHDISMSKRAGA